ncbi:membrane protein [Natronobacillus azotifigens]|uniref:YihY/virulence factor BrkB family protein n=1 Tax=Natronobacillus azotifigens TaxID=472978 RepID=A0A9J6RAX3_9BACI|nr:YihY/virulence factor BrkB family protein [Natronobacillus azotifigens]MCZ0702826.1 YihY/virulence factor BrkB family protein [Natronobacillus azotifigens]
MKLYPMISIGKKFVDRFNDNEVTGQSARLAYFFLLSLFPLLIFLVTLLGYLPIDYQDVMDFMATYIPGEDTLGIIENNLDQVVDNRSGSLLSIGILGTLWSASNGINAIMRSFNKAYKVEEDRSFIVSRLIAILLLFAMLIVIVVALLLPVFGRMIGVYIFSLFGVTDEFVQVWNMLRWIISSSIFFIVFLALYKLAPNKKVYFRDAVFGAIFTTVGWQLVSLGFSFYVNELGNYSATYGSLGGIIVLMIWFYITGMIIITGGEINAFIAERRMKKKKS